MRPKGELFKFVLVSVVQTEGNQTPRIAMLMTEEKYL